MALKLKHKIALGGIFLFGLLILVGAGSFYYFNRITAEAKGIVKDNYETLNFAWDMLGETEALSGPDSLAARNRFENILVQQEQNITESGERELTDSLRGNFEAFKRTPSTDSLRQEIRENILDIMDLNLQAINKKNLAANAFADRAKTIITLILTLCILVGLTFIFNFPNLVASPIAKLTEGIQSIAAKNYSQRIHLNRRDEFGRLAEAFNSMAEKLDEYEHSNLARILFEKQRAETVIHSLKDASIGIDNKGVVLFANQQALQLLSLDESAIVGKPVAEVQRRNDLFRFLLGEESQAPFKIVVDGKENYFTRESVDIRQGTEKAGTVLVLKNITSFKELDVAKTNFIATISHELKTPLAASDFSLKLLEDPRVGNLSAEQKELIGQLRHDNQRMLKILSELLNLSQVEAGKIQLNVQDTDPYRIAGQSIQAVASAALEKKVTIENQLPPSLGLFLADPDKISWVLNNFLTNAIRYAPPESTIVLSARQDGPYLSFTVTDRGPGIADAYLPRIFERYFQVPGRSEQQGSGIGLAICKELVEAMGGKIWVKSRTGEGSSFGFDLPRAASPEN